MHRTPFMCIQNNNDNCFAWRFCCLITSLLASFLSIVSLNSKFHLECGVEVAWFFRLELGAPGHMGSISTCFYGPVAESLSGGIGSSCLCLVERAGTILTLNYLNQ